MKIKTVFALLLLSSLSLTSCFQNTTTTVSSGGQSSGGGDSGGTDGDGSSGGGTSGDGASGGGTSGGDGTTGGSYPINSYTILVAGQGSGVGGNRKEENVWKPWGNSDNISNLGKELLPKISEAKLYFQSDSKLDVRFKLLQQPDPPAGSEYCYGRTTGQADDAHPYTKVTFKVSLRDVSCQSGDNNCSLGSRYQTKTVGPVSVGSYSQVLQLGHLRHPSVEGTVLEVHDVISNNQCQYNGDGTSCDPDQYLRTASCWEALMEFATDYTESF